MSVREAHDVESQVREAVMTARREVRELKVHVHSFDEEEPEQKVEMNGKDRVVKSDFGRDGC
jgi:divalent metal cation (Fe/Co/Zn/Cd) transporter